LSKKNSKNLQVTDPHFEREAAKYESPIPSREFILDILAEEGVPTEESQLVKLLGLKKDQLDALAKRLAAMERAGQILRNRKGAILVAKKLDLIAGRVIGHPDGFGFVTPDDGSPDLYLSQKEMDTVLHGDRVMVREGGADRRGRREAAVVEVLERAQTRLVGRLHIEHKVLYVVAAERRISQDILIPAGDTNGAVPGQVVVAELVSQPNRHAQPIGRIVEILGGYTDPGMEIEIALRKHDLPNEFSDQAERQAQRLPDGVSAGDAQGRVDLRDLALVTIDGETAKDFDDAVYCDKEGKNYRMIVAIADVSHYVRHGDALDLEARERGNSVYFPRRVIPMLPEKLSNGLCSLNPDVDRLAVVCDAIISPIGEIKSYKFYDAVFRSHARLTYTQVAAALAEPGAVKSALIKGLLPRLQSLNELFRVLLVARGKRGAIDFETTETQIEFDDEGKIKRIFPVVRNDAHRLIEECMLAANVCASEFLKKHEQTALYRVHEGPTPEKLASLREFLKEFGLQLSGGAEPHAKDYAALLLKLKGRPDVQLLQTVLLRSLKQAQYSPENLGHFGLAYEAYTHFTSPIRRYPDLLVHRAIKAAIAKDNYKPGNWQELGAHCSQTERRADEATRDVTNWLKCYFMQDRINEEYDGTISAVTSFGIFVALDDVFVEGLVHVSELGSDYFKFDATKHQMLGERTAKRYRLGDRVRVKVVRVDLDTARIEFNLPVESGGAAKLAARKREVRR
jgi:ribonuclease R